MSMETVMIDAVKLPGDDDLWVIQIGNGYGAFLFRGNEADAEHMRAGKAQWEGTYGNKWRMDDPAFGLSGRVDQLARAQRADATLQAQQSNERYGRTATWRNYGRSDASLAAIAALGARDSASSPG
jgi:hypothetical protein